jgi:thiamine-phosphate pyrophosphorylase
MLYASARFGFTGNWLLATALLLYYITDRKQFAGPEPERRERLLQKIEEASRSGVDYIQLREKDLPSRELEQLAREAMRRLAGSKSKLLMNSRTDIALAVGAHGVHLRSYDISPEDVRKVWRDAGLGTVPIIAVSCHAESGVVAAKQSAAHFTVFGPVFEKSRQAVAGLDELRAGCRQGMPILALGGVTLENAPLCIAAGAAGVAGIRLFQDNEIESVAKVLRL